jgi:predicted DNA-binding protein (UPF0251 family)
VSRPFCNRRIAGRPGAPAFKPQGVPACELEEVTLRLDEFEAMRLADLGGLYQAAAAQQMNVSRATFSRIVEAAHRTVADAIVHGKLLRIEGGPVQLAAPRCCLLHDEHEGLAGAWLEDRERSPQKDGRSRRVPVAEAPVAKANKTPAMDAPRRLAAASSSKRQSTPISTRRRGEES